MSHRRRDNTRPAAAAPIKNLIATLGIWACLFLLFLYMAFDALFINPTLSRFAAGFIGILLSFGGITDAFRAHHLEDTLRRRLHTAETRADLAERETTRLSTWSNRV